MYAHARKLATASLIVMVGFVLSRLLGLVRAGDKTVLQTLAAFDLDPDDVRRAVAEADRRAG